MLSPGDCCVKYERRWRSGDRRNGGVYSDDRVRYGRWEAPGPYGTGCSLSLSCSLILSFHLSLSSPPRVLSLSLSHVSQTLCLTFTVCPPPSFCLSVLPHLFLLPHHLPSTSPYTPPGLIHCLTQVSRSSCTGRPDRSSLSRCPGQVSFHSRSPGQVSIPSRSPHSTYPHGIRTLVSAIVQPLPGRLSLEASGCGAST